MKIAIGIFFVLAGVGLGYACLRLAGLFGQLTVMVGDVDREVVPILNRLQTTVDEVNSELGKIDEITGSVVNVTGTLEHTTSAMQSAISAPIKAAASCLGRREPGLLDLPGRQAKGVLMGKIVVGLTVLAGAALGTAAALAYRISQETGKSFTEALNEVPAEAERYWEEFRQRGMEAVSAGREAAQQKQHDIEQQLRG